MQQRTNQLTNQPTNPPTDQKSVLKQYFLLEKRATLVTNLPMKKKILKMLNERKNYTLLALHALQTSYIIIMLHNLVPLYPIN
jgi:hypothetical protein